MIAASSDTEDDAKKIRDGLGLTFPVAFGVNASELAGLVGAFYDSEDEEPYLHVTGYLIAGDGKVKIAVYSTGSVGRLNVGDALCQTRDLAS